MIDITRAVITSVAANMTPELVIELINTNHARKPLALDDIYYNSMSISTQALDSYFTRMAESTLKNYAVDFAQGRALMNSHRTGGWVGNAELPIGRTFSAELRGTAIAPDSDAKAGTGLETGVYFYIQRNLKLTEVETNHVIGGIEGGTINDVSVGLTLGAEGWYRCSICGCDLRDWDSCSHVPGAKYDQGLCFAWIENAHGQEASLVYKGATPNAVIDKAIRMAQTGQMPQKDAVALADQWGVRLFDQTIFSFDRKAENVSTTLTVNGATGTVVTAPVIISTANTELVEASRANTDSDEANLVREGVNEVMDWTVFLEGIRSVDSGLADRLVGIEDDSARTNEVLTLWKQQRSTISDLKPRAELGDKWVKALIDEAVKARVGAEGDKFSEEKYRAVLINTNDPEFIQGEIDTYNRVKERVFGNGKRPTSEAKRELEKTAPLASTAQYK